MTHIAPLALCPLLALSRFFAKFVMSFNRLAPESFKEAAVLADRIEKLEPLSFVPYKRCRSNSRVGMECR